MLTGEPVATKVQAGAPIVPGSPLSEVVENQRLPVTEPVDVATKALASNRVKTTGLALLLVTVKVIALELPASPDGGVMPEV